MWYKAYSIDKLPLMKFSNTYKFSEELQECRTNLDQTTWYEVFFEKMNQNLR